MRIVVSGEMGAGKSTAVRRAMAWAGWERPAGFFTHWDGAGRGGPALVLETWGGVRRTVARRIGGAAVSGELPYEVDAEAFGAGVEDAWRGAAPDAPVVIDELGLMEWTVPTVAEEIAKRLRGTGLALVVVQRRAMDRWLAAMGRERVDGVAEIDEAGRDEWPLRLTDWLGLNKKEK